MYSSELSDTSDESMEVKELVLFESSWLSSETELVLKQFFLHRNESSSFRYVLRRSGPSILSGRLATRGTPNPLFLKIGKEELMF
jgi:hypothetical protein